MITARVVQVEFGVLRATVIVTYNKVLNRSYMVRLRDWTAPDGEHYHLLGEAPPEISDSDTRYAINMALLEFQDYQPST